MNKIGPILIPQIIIAVMFCAIFGGAVYIIFVSDITFWSETQEKIALYLLGILSAGLLQILNYFYSSSIGSKMKTIEREK